MRTTSWILLPVAVSSLIAIGCSQPGGEGIEMAMTVDVAALRAEIEATNVKWIEAFNAGDAAGLTALYTEDATMLPASGELIVGRAAIEAYRAAEFMASTTRAISATTIEVGGSGDLAYEIGRWVDAEVLADGGEVETRGTYVVVWKRNADGSLKLHVETWTVEAAEM